jgi:predicted DNA-binding protein
MHTLQFDTHTEQTLNQLATRAGKETDEFIKDVISEYLEEQGGVIEADAAYTRYLAGEEKTVSLDELERRLGLES